MQRREFLKSALAATALPATAHLLADDEERGQVITVIGPVPAGRLGATLPHEHVLVDFVGADKVSRDRYDRDEVAEVALPHLKRLRAAGCQTLVECTPAFLGRDPVLLKGLSEASGLRLVTNTGYYGARKGKFLPKHAFKETADQLAKRWLAEWRNIEFRCTSRVHHARRVLLRIDD